MQKHISIFGAAGRMGQTLIKLIDESDDLELSGALDQAESVHIAKAVIDVVEGLSHTSKFVTFIADPLDALIDAHVVIDFALPENIEARIEACRASGVAMLIGTTGLSDEQQGLIRDAGAYIPILWASNMSLGVNTVFALAANAARALGKDFDITIEETHHEHKVDAPSGTALSIGDVIGDAVGAVEIEYKSFREGEVIGDHTVIFESDNERIEIHHHAKDRALFAQGALTLARRLADKPKGCYRVRDLI